MKIAGALTSVDDNDFIRDVINRVNKGNAADKRLIYGSNVLWEYIKRCLVRQQVPELDLDDGVQEVLIKVDEHLFQYDDSTGSSPSGWLKRLIHYSLERIAYDLRKQSTLPNFHKDPPPQLGLLELPMGKNEYYKKRNSKRESIGSMDKTLNDFNVSRQTLHDITPSPTAFGPVDVTVSSEIRKRIQKWVKHMSPKTRRLATLRFVNNYSSMAIKEITGVTSEVLGTHLCVGRKILRRGLADIYYAGREDIQSK
jgi:RNA polymerase sigma factor (sigma-70 family)